MRLPSLKEVLAAFPEDNLTPEVVRAEIEKEDAGFDKTQTAAKKVKVVKTPGFRIEVPQESRTHFLEVSSNGGLEFWAFKNRPRVFLNEKLIFTFDKKPVAEAVVSKIEDPWLSACQQTGKYRKYWKVMWHPNSVKRY